MSLRVSAILLCSGVVAGWSQADEYLSNLANEWIDPGNPEEQSIGDIEVLDYWYGPFIVYFSTGSGLGESGYAKMYRGVPRAVSTNSTVTIEQFRLNSVTFEFLGSPTSPWTNISMTIQVFQQVGTNSVLVGELGNDTVNPTPTQWPKDTTFIDFHPSTNIMLKPSSDYFVSLSEPYNFPPVFGLLFTLSSHYVTSTDWRMGPTTTHVPVNFTEYLKFALNATLIQETNSTAGLAAKSGVSVSNVKLSASMMGSNIVLSWPASTAASQLYASPSFESGVWSPVPTQPVVINDNFTVTLPLSGSGSYFRLQGQ